MYTKAEFFDFLYLSPSGKQKYLSHWHSQTTFSEKMFENVFLCSLLNLHTNKMCSNVIKNKIKTHHMEYTQGVLLLVTKRG